MMPIDRGMAVPTMAVRVEFGLIKADLAFADRVQIG